MTTALRLPAMVMVMCVGLNAAPVAIGHSTLDLTPLGAIKGGHTTSDLLMRPDPLAWESDVEV